MDNVNLTTSLRGAAIVAVNLLMNVERALRAFDMGLMDDPKFREKFTELQTKLEPTEDGQRNMFDLMDAEGKNNSCSG